MVYCAPDVWCTPIGATTTYCYFLRRVAFVVQLARVPIASALEVFVGFPAGATVIASAEAIRPPRVEHAAPAIAAIRAGDTISPLGHGP